MSNKTLDDLEAVREVTETLKPFSNEDRERIIRWVREKLGMGQSSVINTSLSTSNLSSSEKSALLVASLKTADIKSFVELKNPQSDRQFATIVAYYYKFEAPDTEKKESIGKEDVTQACRLVGRNRIRYPFQTLTNALNDGYLDKAERGQFKINTVGENLVAMVLPASSPQKPISRQTKSNIKSSSKTKKHARN